MAVCWYDAALQRDVSSELNQIASDHFALMMRNGKTPEVFVGGEFDGLAYFPTDLAGSRYCLTATGLFAMTDEESLHRLPAQLPVTPDPRKDATVSIFTLNRLHDQELVALVLGVEPDNHAAGRIASAMGLDGWKNGVPIQDVTLDCGALGPRRLLRLEASLELGRRAFMSSPKGY